ncbi:MAG TPA: response regulator [Desulfobacteraceae bacterium]|nr:response regulator [Desulfobacteraceae bacterium]|tara:strand:+ start:1317 stop:1742 length:426 start_codon:yes stop_codon:yes gene_type:complete
MTFSIMVVDDSLPMRGVLKKTLRAAGYGASEFLEAENGNHALEVMGQHPVDIVITDFNMPRMNGLELIRAMKANALLRKIPVIVVSTEGSLEKVTEIIDEGAAGYVKKPFSPEQIRDLLIELLGEPSDEDGIDDSGDEFDF